MKYRLINEELNDKRKVLSITEIVLKNRGIDDPEAYLNLDDTALYHFSMLSNIDKAVEMLLKHIGNKSVIGIIVDSDCDGQCSASMLYQYLKEIYDDNNIIYFIHTKKQHGISPEIIIPESVKLLLVPDAGSNDVIQSELLSKRGIDIISLDHHEREVKDNPFAIIVNPKWDDEYPNWELSGGAVVYKFLQALDYELWENKADKYLDLVALSLISDSMDLRSPESKRLVDKGLSNIQNKLFTALIEKQNYSIGGIVNIINIQFYITPLINGMIRSSTLEEKELLFKAFCQMDEEFDYKKRGETETVKEDIYTRVARLCVNNKAKQNREIDKSLEEIIPKIERFGWDKNKILFVNADDLDNSYTGLVCMKLSSQYSKPCILLRETSWKPGYLGGSGRNYDGSPIANLKDFILSTGLFSMAQGHASSFGVEIEKENIRKAIEKVNELLKDVEFETQYKVDFVLDAREVTIEFVRELDKLKDYWGNNIKESLICVKNICFNTKDLQIMGKELNSWKFSINDDVMAIKFKCSEDDEILKLSSSDWGGTDIKINSIGKLNFSSYNGIITPQLILLDYEVVQIKDCTC
ncbi:MAG TPA: hypothetical protein DC057_11925 [Spirochaetia bacterium]|nr:hypothetical protein [Spirochaetia bacterium]